MFGVRKTVGATIFPIGLGTKVERSVLDKLATASGGIVLSVLVLALAGFGPAEAHVVAGAYPPDALAEASWGDFSRAALMRSSLLTQWLRVPIFAGLACVLLALTGAARLGITRAPALSA